MAGKGNPKTGGRKKGMANRATEAQLIEAAAVISGEEVKGRKRAIAVMWDFMELFAGYAAYYQPTPPTAPQQNVNQNESKFLEYAKLACATATQLAPFQSPTFRSIQAPLPPPDPNASKTKARKFTLGIFETSGEAAPAAATVIEGPRTQQ